MIFTLVGLSVLEAMLVSFLIDLDGYRGKKAQSSTSVQVDVQIEDEHCTGEIGSLFSYFYGRLKCTM